MNGMNRAFQMVRLEGKARKLGDRRDGSTGFFITQACIGCGKCSRNCPQKCINRQAELPVQGGGSSAPGTALYKIRQENCLHCGLCRENCPVGAIVKRGEETC